MSRPSPNFAFLTAYDPLLAKLPTLAERYFADDPSTAIIKLRQFAEELAKQVAAHAGYYAGPEEDFLSLLRRLGQGHNPPLPRQTGDLFHGF